MAPVWAAALSPPSARIQSLVQPNLGDALALWGNECRGAAQ